MTTFRILAALAPFFGFAWAQGPEPSDLIGHWEGAIIRDGAPLRVEVDITGNGDGALEAASTFPEWFFYVLPADPLSIDGTDVVIEDFYAQQTARLTWDRRYRQLVGETANGVYQVHLKPMPAPPAPPFTEERVAYTSADGTKLSAILTVPKTEGPHPAMLIFRGRGCSYGSLGQARFFASYGIATMSPDKRGAGQSEGDCAKHSSDNLAEDGLAAFRVLARDKRIDRRRIGLKGSSAGAWDAQYVTELAMKDRRLPDPAFIVTWIGPATSIADQQRQAAQDLAVRRGFGAEVGETAASTVDILISENISDEEAFERLNAIRERAVEEGWFEPLFAPDDLPSSPDDVAGLFLKRFRFDPENVLANLGDTPYLAIFGEEDGVVPLEPNVAALDPVENVRVVIVPGAGHSISHGDQVVDLPGGATYFKHDTVEPMFPSATIDFLRMEGFLPR